MKIAFVGKGGSGKSTVSSLFVRHLVEADQHILAVDADINQHFAELIGAGFSASKALSDSGNKTTIRRYLAGENKRIISPKHVIKSTPPGKGSRLITLHDSNIIIVKYGSKFASNAYFMHVGTYKSDGIGTSCYHTSLSIFENILSHTPASAPNEWVVTDMVAGTDAFSGPLHAMFDSIFIVVEPSAESLGVYRQFIRLAEAAGVDDRVRIVANKVEDEDDIAYLQQETGMTPVTTLSYDPSLRRARRNGESILLNDERKKAMRQIADVTRAMRLHPNDHLARLHRFHRHFASQDFTVAKYGDTLSQIDPTFQFNN